MKLVDLEGEKFTSLEVISRATNSSDGKPRWYCLCDCGNTAVVSSANLRRKKHPTRSCGCFAKARSSLNTIRQFTTHGLSSHPVYTVYQNMMQRCYNKKSPEFHNYGERGVSVCKEWRESFLSFSEWALTGWRDGLSIDRIDNNDGYSPDNCRWATQRQQCRNMRTTKLSEDDIPVIRIMRNDGFSYKKIASMFHVGETVIFDIMSGTKWGEDLEDIQ